MINPLAIACDGYFGVSQEMVYVLERFGINVDENKRDLSIQINLLDDVLINIPALVGVDVDLDLPDVMVKII